MRILISMVLLTLSCISFGQSYNFKPTWNKGDTKHISITLVEREYENNELISDTTRFNEAKVAILEDNRDDYTVEITLDNQALIGIEDLFDTANDDNLQYKDLKLLFSINKNTAEAELLNWEESRDFVNQSLDQAAQLIERKTPEASPMIEFMFMPIKQAFVSKETVEGFILPMIDYLFVPYGKDFQIGSTLSFVEVCENPFDPSNETTATILVTLESLDESKSTCVINEEVEIDFSEFLNMVKPIIQGMMENMGTDENALNFDDFEMDIENSRIIEFDFGSSWVTKSVEVGRVSGVDPIKGVLTKGEEITTCIIK